MFAEVCERVCEVRIWCAGFRIVCEVSVSVSVSVCVCVSVCV